MTQGGGEGEAAQDAQAQFKFLRLDFLVPPQVWSTVSER
jgi:hypothetical protein